MHQSETYGVNCPPDKKGIMASGLTTLRQVDICVRG